MDMKKHFKVAKLLGIIDGNATILEVHIKAHGLSDDLLTSVAKIHKSAQAINDIMTSDVLA